MRSSIFRRLAVVSAIALMALGTTACDSGDDTTPTTPTIPTPNVTETFAGSINVNGAATFTFPTPRRNRHHARALTPETIQVSLAIGTERRQLPGGSEQRSRLAGGSTGNVSGAGTLCVRISDIGQITQQTGFEIVVAILRSRFWVPVSGFRVFTPKEQTRER
jgi:hypothetical protein